MLLMDDYGWANAGWHRNYTAPGGEFVPYTDEVQTPVMDQLVRDGINLDRQYVYKVGAPRSLSRSLSFLATFPTVFLPPALATAGVRRWWELHVIVVGTNIPFL